MQANDIDSTDDPLDSANYDPLEHLNAIFSHPSTLASVSKTSEALHSYQDELDEDISDLIDQQAFSNAESIQRIQAAKADLSELFRKIEDVRARALKTEEAIKEMTADIKQLDNTKKNLTLSMTALKRLQMLTTAYEQLRALSKSRQYRECAQLLQAVIQLMAHFKSYRSIDQIATLSRNVAELQWELLEQICEDFELTFAKGEVAQRRGMLTEACLVMDALGENARSRLITWYCNTQLREYRQVFRGNEEAGSLDNISRRYSWFRRMLKTYDEEHAGIFPSSWRVNEVMANAFCEGTRDDFKGILSRSMRNGQTLDVNLLLSCLQETLDFEHSLERRFANSSRTSMDTFSSSDAPLFTQVISEAFEPYLSVWVDSQDKQLSSMLVKYRQQPPKPPDEDFHPQLVISSSTELFNFYRHSLAQCAKLSTGQPLADLSKVFGKYLEQYSQQILLLYISERPTGVTPSKSPTVEDIIVVLNTADYCYATITQLEEKIKSRVDEAFKPSIDLQSQADAFMGIASAAVRGLVRKVELELEHCWREMRNTPWNRLDHVGDHSSYVSELTEKIKSNSGQILEMLHKQQYARAFADNLVEFIANAYVANIVFCKPVSEVGAEQMLLDAYALRSTFSSLLPAPAPSSFLKRVNATTARIDSLLKTLQVRASPPEALVQAYLIHIADRSDINFRKILELKGVRRQEQPQLMELFAMHKAAPQHKDLVASSPFLSPLQVNAPTTSTTGLGMQGLGSLGSTVSAASISTSSLPGRFDPATLGSAIMSAARDGVDRLGSPALGASGSGTNTPILGQGLDRKDGGAGTGGDGIVKEAGGNMSENLRNIGKFFKRDLGGLGGRFGGGG